MIWRAIRHSQEGAGGKTAPFAMRDPPSTSSGPRECRRNKDGAPLAPRLSPRHPEIKGAVAGDAGYGRQGLAVTGEDHDHHRA